MGYDFLGFFFKVLFCLTLTPLLGIDGGFSVS